MAPVSRKAAATTYNAAMVIKPGLAKPDSASPGEIMPEIKTSTSAAIMVISAGTRLLASAPSTASTINSVISISTVIR